MKKIGPLLIDLVIAILLKEDHIYTNKDNTLYSVVKINDEYMKFTEGMKSKFPGYSMDKNSLIKNDSDIEIDPEEFTSLLLSKDLS